MIRVLSIVDSYGWAYDRVSTDIQRYIGEDYKVSKTSMEDVGKNSALLNGYDVYILWGWINAYKNAFHTNLIPRHLHDKTIFMVCSEKACSLAENMEPKQLESIRFIGCASKPVAERLQAKYPLKHVFDLTHGVDLTQFKETPPPSEFIVGWVGSHTRPLKRYEYAVQACDRADTPLKLASSASPDHYVSPYMMSDFYSSVSCLFITSESECHPLVYYEALASGRPVVSTMVGDINGVAVDGVNGFYVSPYTTIDELTGKLTALKELYDTEEYEEMCQRARESVQHLDWCKVIKNYETAFDYASGKHSACMLISRLNTKMEHAVTSILSRQPDEFNAYVDTTQVNPREVRDKVAEIASRANYVNPLNIREQVDTGAEDHHDDVTRSVHRAIVEARYPWVLWVDDDDEVVGNPSEYIKYAYSGTAMIYGDVEQRWEDGRIRVAKSGDVHSLNDCDKVLGSVVLYNREAVEKAVPYIDVNRDDFESRPDWYGYFWDRQIVYWVCRLGYGLLKMNTVFSIQNVNPQPSEKRLSLYGKWSEIVDYYNGCESNE